MEQEIDLRRYVEVLIRHWKWIVGLALVAAVMALVVSFLILPTYEAMALVAVTEPRYMMRFDPRFETVNNIQQVYRAYPELAGSDELPAWTLFPTMSRPFEICRKCWRPNRVQIPAWCG